MPAYPTTTINIHADGLDIPINDGDSFSYLTVGQAKQKILDYIDAIKTLPDLTVNDITFTITERPNGYDSDEVLHNDSQDLPYPDIYGDDSGYKIQATFPVAPANAAPANVAPANAAPANAAAANEDPTPTTGGRRRRTHRRNTRKRSTRRRR